MSDTSTPSDEISALLSFPLSAFFRKEFMVSVLEQRNDQNLMAQHLPTQTLMSLVGEICAHEEFASSMRQPTVGDFLKLTAHQVRKYPGISAQRFHFLEAYLAIFDVRLSEMVTTDINLNEIEGKILRLVEPKTEEEK